MTSRRLKTDQRILFSEIIPAIREEIADLGPKDFEELNYVTLSFRCEMTEILDRVGAECFPVFYLSDRGEFFSILALGHIRRFTAESLEQSETCWKEIESYLAKDPELKIYGGFGFPGKVDPIWKVFGGVSFYIPRFEFFKDAQSLLLTCRVTRGDLEDISALDRDLKSLQKEVSSNGRDLPSCVHRGDCPDYDQWQEVFKKTRQGLEKQRYEKIVLARRSTLEFDDTVNVVPLMRALKEGAKNCFQFCFAPEKNKAFLGASPERLFHRAGRRIESEAIAGTMGRGMTEIEDVRIERDLLSSLKNEREHRYVVDALLKEFRFLCEEYSYDKTIQLLKLTENQHLITRFWGKLREGVSDQDVIKALQPTPAIGGYPREEAVEDIMKLEPFVRGWYAGGVGYLGQSETQFVVGIRSGLIDFNQVHLFAGAGLVEGSEAEDEWQEIERKMKTFLRILKG